MARYSGTASAFVLFGGIGAVMLVARAFAKPKTPPAPVVPQAVPSELVAPAVVPAEPLPESLGCYNLPVGCGCSDPRAVSANRNWPPIFIPFGI